MVQLLAFFTLPPDFIGHFTGDYLRCVQTHMRDEMTLIGRLPVNLFWRTYALYGRSHVIAALMTMILIPLVAAACVRPYVPSLSSRSFVTSGRWWGSILSSRSSGAMLLSRTRRECCCIPCICLDRLARTAGLFVRPFAFVCAC